MNSAAQVRAQVEASLALKVPAPFSPRASNAPALVPTSLAVIDDLTGGLPRSSLTEVSGPPSSGRTALEIALLASLTSSGDACALIDAEDAFDPISAQAAGVRLERLLWVRCGGLAQALRAADLLLGAGGFGAVIVDLAGIPARWTRRVPLSYWFRFRRAVENTPTVLLLMDEEPCAGSAASLVLQLEGEGAVWSESRKSKIETRKSEAGRRKPLYRADLLPHPRLLRGIRWRAEVVRNRNKFPSGEGVRGWCQITSTFGHHPGLRPPLLARGGELRQLSIVDRE